MPSEIKPVSSPFYIKIGVLFWVVQAIPESLSGDTVTIEIRRLSDSYTWNFSTLAFASGSNSGAMALVSGITWKASFTPPTSDTYLVTITHAGSGAQHTQALIARNQATSLQSIRSALATDAANVFIRDNEFAETITYIPDGGTAKQIPAIVNRKPITPSGEDSGRSLLDQMDIYVANSSTYGVTTVKKGYDSVYFPRIPGGDTIQWRVVNIMEVDEGVWRLLCQK